jgi:hypothetical protein
MITINMANPEDTFFVFSQNNGWAQMMVINKAIRRGFRKDWESFMPARMIMNAAIP